VAENEWTTDEHGTRRFRSGDVELVVRQNAGDVEPEVCIDETADERVDISIEEGGVRTFSECRGQYHDFAIPITIPWPILFELVDWRRKQEQS